MILSTVVVLCDSRVSLARPQKIELHNCSRPSPCTDSRGEGAYMTITNISMLPNDSAPYTCLNHVERQVQGPNSNEVVYT